MVNNPHQLLNLIIAISGFVLVLSIWLGVLLGWAIWRKQRSAKLEERMRMVLPHLGGEGRILRLWHDGHENTVMVPVLIGKGGPMERFKRTTAAAGLRTNPEKLLAGLGTAVGIVALLIWLLTGSVVAATGAGIAVVLAWYLYLAHRTGKQRDTFDRQLIDALDLAARSLRVGHPLVASFRLISEEIPAPVGELFGEVCQEQQLGMAMDQSLRRAAEHYHSEDLGLFVAAVVTQLRSGGNLADMMERVAGVIRERFRLARRVRLLTAQTQFSKRVLLAMPFFLFVLLNVMDPNYMRPLLTTPSGQMVMAFAGGGLLCGWLTMNWLSHLTP